MLKNLFKFESSMVPAKTVEANEVSDEYKEVSWKSCFDYNKEVPCQDGKFMIYVGGKLDSEQKKVCFLFIHGCGHSALVWAHVAEKLKAVGHNVVAYDARGHGSSSHENEMDFSIKTMAQDCAHIAKSLPKGTQIVLVGHSMGGNEA